MNDPKTGRKPSWARTLALVFCVFVLLPVGLAVLVAWAEASAYNRVTGANVTTWDALWVDLRVQGDPR